MAPFDIHMFIDQTLPARYNEHKLSSLLTRLTDGGIMQQYDLSFYLEKVSDYENE